MFEWLGSNFSWVTSLVTIIPLVLAANGMWKKITKAIKEQKEFIDEANKFYQKVTLALADKKIDNDEIEDILKGLQSLKNELGDTVDAYKEAGTAISDLIVKAKNKVG